MSDRSDIPVLTDLIEPGAEISISDLGLEDEFEVRFEDPDDTQIEIPEPEIDMPVEPGLSAAAPSDPLAQNPELERKIRRILDDHTPAERAFVQLMYNDEIDTLTSGLPRGRSTEYID